MQERALLSTFPPYRFNRAFFERCSLLGDPRMTLLFFWLRSFTFPADSDAYLILSSLIRFWSLLYIRFHCTMPPHHSTSLIIEYHSLALRHCDYLKLHLVDRTFSSAFSFIRTFQRHPTTFPPRRVCFWMFHIPFELHRRLGIFSG
jgi:hypothetical protein